MTSYLIFSTTIPDEYGDTTTENIKVVLSEDEASKTVKDLEERRESIASLASILNNRLREYDQFNPSPTKLQQTKCKGRKVGRPNKPDETLEELPKRRSEHAKKWRIIDQEYKSAYGKWNSERKAIIEYLKQKYDKQIKQLGLKIPDDVYMIDFPEIDKEYHYEAVEFCTPS